MTTVSEAGTTAHLDGYLQELRAGALAWQRLSATARACGSAIANGNSLGLPNKVSDTPGVAPRSAPNS